MQPCMNLLPFSISCLLAVTCLTAQNSKDAKPAAPAAAKVANDPVAVDATMIDQFTANVGKTVTVTGQVQRTKDWDGGMQKKKKMNFVDLKGGYFTTVTFEDDFAAFGKNLPATAYKGKKIAVTGELEERNGKYQIVLKSPDQVKVLDDEPKTDKDAKPDKTEKTDEEEKKPSPEANEPAAAADKASEDKKRVDPKKFFK